MRDFQERMERGAQKGRAVILNDDPRQMDLAHTAPDPAGLAKRLAAAPLRPRKAQLPADHGLFSDEATQLDLTEVSLWR